MRKKFEDAGICFDDPQEPPYMTKLTEVTTRVALTESFSLFGMQTCVKDGLLDGMRVAVKEDVI